MILLRANTELHQTFERLIEAMKVPVKWNGIFVVIDNYMILQGEVRSLFFHFDTRNVATNIIDIPVKEDEIGEVGTNMRVQNAINLILYAFGKWGTIKGVRVDKSFEQLNTLFTDIMKEMQFAPSIDGDELTLQIPAYREDMDSYPDVAEEVIRMYGYEHVIPTFMPTAKVTLGGLNLKQKTELKIKRALCAAGAYEGVHYSFFSPSDLDLLRLPEDAPERKAIKLINPINVDLSLMRTTLASEMLYAISRNQKKGILEGRIFELGNVFIPKALPLTEYPDERETLCAGVFGEKESFYTLKGLAETVADALNVSFTYEAAERTFLHPYQTAEIFCEGERVGYLGKLSYEIQDELDMRVPAYVMEIDLAALKKWYGKEQIFTPLPKFAEEKRDFAFVVDKNITCAQIENGIREACKYVTDVNLFDVYEGIQLGPDKKSMAFSVVFTPQEEEFTGEMVEGFVKKILKHLEATLDIRLRA